MEVGRMRLYTYRDTVTTRMTSALRWAAMRAILTFHNCEGQSRKTVSQTTTFEVKGKPKQIRTYQPNRLTVKISVLLNLLCVLILFQNTSSHRCFSLFSHSKKVIITKKSFH